MAAQKTGNGGHQPEPGKNASFRHTVEQAACGKEPVTGGREMQSPNTQC